VRVTDGSPVGLLTGGAGVVVTVVGESPDTPVVGTGCVPAASVDVVGTVFDGDGVPLSAVLNVTAGDDEGLLPQPQPITASAAATAHILRDFGIMRITTHGRCGLDLPGRR
jgi:hypothetical protein